MLDFRNTPTLDLQLCSRPWAWSAAMVSGSSQAPGATPDSGWPEALSVIRKRTSANSPSRSTPLPASGFSSYATVTPSRTKVFLLQVFGTATSLSNTGCHARHTPSQISANPTSSAQTATMMVLFILFSPYRSVPV
ncbi:hypothetical protein D3C87_1362660 [compost metagenome]